MIFISKSGYLKYKNLTFKCAFGKAGVGNKKKEGDNITPKGTYKVIKIYYRKDRIKKLISQIRPIQIKKNMGWCDDPKCKKYNRLIILPNQFSHEKLYRKDNIYDLILVLNYNIKPTIKNKGSAIFIHVAKKKYERTAGCITLKKNNLIKLITTLSKNVSIKIN
jgi:L,D-peptidoglycan transpeptidase YkuD (ErfK/YbiS/YcfS/YnhG family)